MTPDLAIRDPRLDGPTYKVKVTLGDRTEKFYVTVNHQGGQPFEVFIRVDRPELHEWVTTVALLVSDALRRGRRLADIAADLQAIHSGGHSLHVLPDGSQCFSLVERLGQVLARHAAGTH